MRLTPPAALVALLTVAIGFAAAPPAEADVIYVKKGSLPKTPGVPDLEVFSRQRGVAKIPGWSTAGIEVIRSVEQPDGSFKSVTYFGIQGRSVQVTRVKLNLTYHFQFLLEKDSAKLKAGADRNTKKPRFAYHPVPVLIPSKAILEYEEDFDSLLDLRLLLGDDDVRLREAGVADPRILTGTYGGKTSDIVKLLGRTDDWVYAFTGYGGVLTRSLMRFRLGINGAKWDSFKKAKTSTPFAEGWLTYVVLRGVPLNRAARSAAVKKGLARGEVVPAVTGIPVFRAAMAARVAPPKPRPSGNPFGTGPRGTAAPRAAVPLLPVDDPEVVLGTYLRPTLHALMLGAARDDRYGGIVLNGEVPGNASLTSKYKKLGPLYQEAVIKVMREFCSWSTTSDGIGDTALQLATNKRARAVGRLAREVVLECLEGALAGRRSPFDALKGVPAGTRVGPKAYLLREEYLPVDPSRKALVAMRVIQGSPDWQTPDSKEEARRVIRALIRLARPRYAKDPKWKADWRSEDFGRGFAFPGETLLMQEVMITLGGAARSGLLVGTTLPSGDVTSSRYLPHVIGLLQDLEHRDRVVLLTAMTQAGVGDASLYKEVVDRMFAICLDNKGWNKTASSAWIRRSRRDAVATLGLLTRLETDLAAVSAAEAAGGVAKGKRLKRVGTGSVTKLIFARLDQLVDAKIAKLASERELATIEMIRQMALGIARKDPRSVWLDSIARGRQLAAGLTNAYHAYAKGSPLALRLEGSRRLEKMEAGLEPSKAVEAEKERVLTEVEGAKKRLAQFPFR
ncbi:MAG: hypothetical protein JKY65_03165 [Planctomycetes bacterium]|nr:hypothetical protein [Planctomycetota bacterium]